MAGAPPTSRLVIEEFGIDAICEWVANGQRIADLCDELNVNRWTIWNWIKSDPVRLSLYNEARQGAGEMWDERAEGHIAKAEDDFALRKADKLATHLRWRSERVSRHVYGAHIQVDQKTTITNLTDEQLAQREAELDAKLAELENPPSADGAG